LDLASVPSWSGSDYRGQPALCIAPSGADRVAADRGPLQCGHAVDWSGRVRNKTNMEQRK